MISVCKLLFDLCLYYTLSGCYLYLFTERYPAVFGVPVLMLSAVIAAALKQRGGGDGKESAAALLLRIIFCLLPGVVLLSCRSIWQIAQFLPAWAYMCFSIWNNAAFADRREFEAHFGFCSKLLALLVFCAVMPSRILGAAAGFGAYLILYLLTGVFLMRHLREEGKSAGGRSAAILIAVVLGSALFAVLGTPRLVLAAFGFIYNYIIVKIILALAYVAAFLVGGIFGAIDIKAEDITLNLNFGMEELYGEEFSEYIPDSGTPGWLKIAGIVLLVIAVIFVIFLIFRRLAGGGASEKKEPGFLVEREKLTRREARKKSGLLRPANPRMTVKKYYRKYLKEGEARGYHRFAADTSLCIFNKFKPAFPAEESWRLRELYTKARYNYRSEVSKGEAGAAFEIWRKIKDSK